MVLIVGKRDYEDVLIRLQGLKETAWLIGEVDARKKEEQDQVVISIDGQA
jgi:phosphoribosylaminoimidazole (AIR) synthetase